MSKERDMLELISQYVHARATVVGDATESEPLDAIAEAFGEVLRRTDEAESKNTIPPIVTRAEEAGADYREEVQKSHEYLSPNWAD